MRRQCTTGPSRAAGAHQLGRSPLAVALFWWELASMDRQERFLWPAPTLQSGWVYFPQSTSQAGEQAPGRGQCAEHSAHSDLKAHSSTWTYHFGLQKSEKYRDQLFYLQLKFHQSQGLFSKLSQKEFFPVANFIQLPILAVDARWWWSELDSNLGRVIAPSITTSNCHLEKYLLMRRYSSNASIEKNDNSLPCTTFVLSKTSMVTCDPHQRVLEIWSKMCIANIDPTLL